MTDLVVDLIARAGYLGIFVLMALENIFPPIPSEVIMGLGGIAAADGRMDFALLVAAATLGTVAGNWPWYWLGRRFGYEGLKPLVERWGRWLTMEWRDVERVTRFFHDRGAWVVFVFRFMPVFRTIISLPAGMAKMPRWRFAVATAAGSTIWNVILGGAGWYLGSEFRRLDAYVGPVAVVLMAAMVATYLYRVATWRPRAER